MPVRKVKGGYQWGRSGTIYPLRQDAERQGEAIKASQVRKPEMILRKAPTPQKRP